MANSACVAIGINRYQFLPPLSYGQADAQALRQFLVCQANLPSSQCLLLTDTSPLVGDQSTYPTKDNILNWLEAGRQNSRQSTSWRWFFFSGYGVSWEQADYLMPIDGNPMDIPGTGIPLRSLFTSLKNQGSDNILVLLDINRSLGFQSGTPVGAETVELARQMGITLVLSSQLNQFSHEAATLGHGLFTAALLEALRYYHTDTTLEHLDQYLHTRLPELSQHHWRPVQIPLSVIPSENARQQLILPSAENSTANRKFAAGTPAAVLGRLDAVDARGEDSPNGSRASLQKNAVSAVETQPTQSAIPMTTATPNQTASRDGAIVPNPDRRSEPETSKTPWWEQLLLWGGGLLLMLLVLVAANVVLRNRDGIPSKQETPVAKQSPVSPITKASPTVSPIPKANPSPATSPSGSAKQSVVSPQTSQSLRLKANQAALDRAKRLLRPNQASLFNKAIVQARQVKPGDPLYQQAQQDLRRWSGVILDLAEGRAAQGNLGAAIAAAQLVPKDDPAVYAKAQQSIKKWKGLTARYKQNQSIIQVAKKQIQPNQASSYSRAIVTLRKVPQGTPGYTEAQQLIAQGSQKIYLLAQARAQQGKLQQAIQTAALVPSGTPSYDTAQKAIAKWKQSKQ